MPSLFLSRLRVLVLLLPLFSGATAVAHPFHLAQPADAPERLLALIEIPAGSSIKYEIDAESGHIVVNRFISMPVHYPANYGSLPSIMAADGDLMDVLVITHSPVAPGALIEVRPIGVLRMQDGEEVDDKFVAVPTTDVDPRFASIHDVSDLAESVRLEIEAFFKVYKDLPPGKKKVITDGFGNHEEAKRLLRATLGPSASINCALHTLSAKKCGSVQTNNTNPGEQQ